MSQEKYCKLVMVTAENNNKFYELTYNGIGSTLTATYGRVDSSSKTISKPLRDWDKIVKSKIKKGYQDVTHLASVTVEDEEDKGKVVIKHIDDKIVNDFLNKMKEYTDGLVKDTYSVTSTSVTEAQVEEAQSILDNLLKIDKKNAKKLNEELLKLYTCIPRYMHQVRSYLMPAISTRLDKHMIQEQDNLDAMAAQVAQNKKDAEALKGKSKDEVVETTLLTKIGITMKEIKNVPKDIKYITDQLTRSKVIGIFEVGKEVEDKKFDKWIKKQKNKETRHLIHGTRCTSVIPILETSLQIRPTGNFQFSGKAYGDGNYFSEVTQKSLGYTGYDDDQVLLIYEVHTGNPYVYNGWYRGNSFTLSYKELSKRGFDSTHVAAGNGLLNSEIIAYKEEQCRIKYAIWLKRR